MHILSSLTRRTRAMGLPKRATLVVLGLFLVACSTEQPLKPAPSSRFIKSIPAVTTPKAKPQVVAKAPQVVEPRIYPEPDVLDGLSAAKVQELLGLPGFKRNDDPAEIWQYRVTNCTLDLFLYETLDSEQRSVAHFETRPGPGQTISAKDCFIAILQAAETGSQTS